MLDSGNSTNLWDIEALLIYDLDGWVFPGSYQLRKGKLLSNEDKSWILSRKTRPMNKDPIYKDQLRKGVFLADLGVRKRHNIVSRSTTQF
jgi:hypothetical protein